ncbi:estradiol 17-beta-dehydrogenase 8-like [Aplysia californica]|uniref:Estradiol 17-beta-dehydrogenase 8-like n=1 Tax=Aplysia californica TaxID=6500 RepID=A0ABM0ZUQ8_APLCA|nr:estradiol 17-beta-dehydrogenase 8-like [Aplysia californica]
MTKTLDLLLNAPVFMTQLCVPHLAKTKGNIINISSILSTMVVPGAFPYSCAKAGLDQFTKYAAAEFGKTGIRVNSIRPGAVITPIHTRGKLTQEAADQLLGACANSSLLGFNATPEDISEVVSFYASDAARFITGDINTSDGGLTVPVVFNGP